MQLEVILAGNRIATAASCKAETTKESIKTKTENGDWFCIRGVSSVKLNQEGIKGTEKASAMHTLFHR